MGVGSRRSNKKRRRAAIVGGDDDDDGGVDLISSLNDDLLLRILDLVPDAEAVVRTHALSRRWRALWTGVTSLRFDFSSLRKPCRSDAAAERYIALVHGALALRAASSAKEPTLLEDLEISFDISELKTKQLAPVSVEAAQGWIRFAVQHSVKSLVLKLKLPWRSSLGRIIDTDLPVLTLDENEIDGYAKMETMHLRLGGAELRLPSSTAVFSSLTDLSLKHIKVPAGGGGYLFSRIVSSVCCPRLQKLHLWLLTFELSTTEVMLRIEADALLELSLKCMFGLQVLELRTPSLQVLSISDSCGLDGFTVSAPRFENLMFWVYRSLHTDNVHDQLSSVRTLNIQLFSHGDDGRNAGTMHLLQCCRLTRFLEVMFEVPKIDHQTVGIIKGRIPLLSHVTHLTVHIRLWERHSSGPGIACLLAQCGNIKYLGLQLRYNITKRDRSTLDLLCDNTSCHWKSHEFSLAHLQEVEFKELIGTDCDFQFVQSVLTKTIGIQKVTISFDQLYWQKGRKCALLSLDGGLWTTCKDVMLSYKWRRCL